MAGIGKVILNVTVTPPVGEPAKTTVESLDDGSFSVVFNPTMDGTFTVVVDFLGDALHLSSSASLAINVVPAPPVPVPTTITLTGPTDQVQVGADVTITGIIV